MHCIGVTISGMIRVSLVCFNIRISTVQACKLYQNAANCSSWQVRMHRPTFELVLYAHVIAMGLLDFICHTEIDKSPTEQSRTSAIPHCEIRCALVQAPRESGKLKQQVVSREDYTGKGCCKCLAMPSWGCQSSDATTLGGSPEALWDLPRGLNAVVLPRQARLFGGWDSAKSRQENYIR